MNKLSPSSNKLKTLAMSLLLAFSVCASSSKATAVDTKHKLSNILTTNGITEDLSQEYSNAIVTLFTNAGNKGLVSDLS